MNLKKLFALVLTVVIFIIILLNINIKEFLNYFYELNLLFFMISFLFYFPLYLIISERWREIVRKDCKISLRESIKMCLAGVSLNSFVPSKLGEFSKAYFLRKKRLTLKRGVNFVMFEKILDIFFLCMFFVVGLLLIQEYNYLYGVLILFCVMVILGTIIYFNFDFTASKTFKKIFWFVFKYKRLRNMIIDTQEFVISLKKNKKRLMYIFFLSFLSWTVQLLQVYFMFLSLNYFVPIKLVFGLVPAAILIGLLPITIAGMGIRDSALIFLFLGYASPSLMAGVGMLLSTRYWVVSIFGLPFFKEYVSK